MPVPAPLFSIIIPTYNRVRHVETAVRSALNQDFDRDRFEVVVIDNASTDGTGAQLESMAAAAQNLVFIREDRPGTSIARNTGWQHARGEFAAFMDDDCRAPQDWLAKACGIVERVASDAFGGSIRSYYDSEKPAWWKDEYRTIRTPAVAGALPPGEYLAGGNFIVRRAILEALDGFSPSFGPVAERLKYGGETELQIRMLESGLSSPLYFDPDLEMFHLVHAEKMTLSWTARYQFASGRSYRAYRREPPEKSLKRSLQLLGQIIRETGIAALRALLVLTRDRRQYPYWQNYFYEVVIRRAYYVGRAVEQLVE